MTIHSSHWFAVILTAALLSTAGCAGLGKEKADVEGLPLEESELESLFATAIDPRRHSITTYDSNNGPVFDGVNRLRRSRQAELSFAGGGDGPVPIIVIQASANRRCTALLDTTSGRSWATQTATAVLGIKPLNPGDQVVPNHVSDGIEGFAGAATSVRFENLTMDMALMYIRAAKGSLGPLARNIAEPKPDVVIGIDMLSAFEFVQFDFPNKKIRLSSTIPYKAQVNRLLAKTPARFVEGSLAVQGAINGSPQTILLDIAGDFSAALPNPEGDTVRQISVGDLVFRNAPTVSCGQMDLGLSAYARVGRTLLSRYRITLANKGRIIYVERPALPDTH